MFTGSTSFCTNMRSASPLALSLPCFEEPQDVVSTTFAPFSWFTTNVSRIRAREVKYLHGCLGQHMVNTVSRHLLTSRDSPSGNYVRPLSIPEPSCKMTTQFHISSDNQAEEDCSSIPSAPVKVPALCLGAAGAAGIGFAAFLSPSARCCTANVGHVVQRQMK